MPVGYTRRCCAFIDILGFRDLLRRQSATQLHDILALMRDPPLLRGLGAGLREHVTISTFSDNICISAAPTYEGVRWLLSVTEQLAHSLLGFGTLLRGAVVVGELVHDDKVVFGDALVRAYAIESQVAEHPRIVLTREFVELVHGLMQGGIAEDPLAPFIAQSVDGPFFLDVLNQMPIRLADPENGSEWALRYRQIAELLQAELNAAVDNPRHFAKHQWFAQYWNLRLEPGTDAALLIHGPGLPGPSPMVLPSD